ncbi:hypothetical protein [Borreliella afzelii]|uniref:Uncharacterized protein n=1 Tax=Borreliella afzelii TaxID=29518 RepID=A0A1L4DGJ8_BORAF|nr:hypothetical protein BLA32_05445 [Borreliella afzelii]
MDYALVDDHSFRTLKSYHWMKQEAISKSKLIEIAVHSFNAFKSLNIRFINKKCFIIDISPYFIILYLIYIKAFIG